MLMKKRGKPCGYWISDTKKAACRQLTLHHLVPKAGLEPARISTVDFESTASTDFATSALKRYAENVVDYTCNCLTRNSYPLWCESDAEKISIRIPALLFRQRA